MKKEHIYGMLLLLIDQFQQNTRTLAPELGLGFDIEEKDNSFKVTFHYSYGYKDCRPSDAPESLDATDYFTFLKTEPLSKLQSYVEDSLNKIADTPLNKLAA